MRLLSFSKQRVDFDRAGVVMDADATDNSLSSLTDPQPSQPPTDSSSSSIAIIRDEYQASLHSDSSEKSQTPRKRLSQIFKLTTKFSIDGLRDPVVVDPALLAAQSTASADDKASREMAPVLTLLAAQRQRLYITSRVSFQSHDQGVVTPALARLVGSVLTVSNDHDEASTFINITDARIQQKPSSIIIHAKRHTKHVLGFENDPLALQWATALHLAQYELSALQSAYTGSLLASRGPLLNGISTLLSPTRLPCTETCNVRFGVGQPWITARIVITPSTKPVKSSKTRHLGTVSIFEVNPVYSNKSNLLATVVDVSGVSAVFPESARLVPHSTMLKIEGGIFKSPKRSKSTQETPHDLDPIYILPSTHAGVAGVETLIRFLIPLFDTFHLYGRPKRLNPDKTNPNSLLFAMPALPRVFYLSLDELASSVTMEKELDWNLHIKSLLEPKCKLGYLGYGHLRELNLDMSRYLITSIGSSKVHNRTVSMPLPMSGLLSRDLRSENSRVVSASLAIPKSTPTLRQGSKSSSSVTNSPVFGFDSIPEQPVSMPQQQQENLLPIESMFSSAYDTPNNIDHDVINEQMTLVPQQEEESPTESVSSSTYSLNLVDETQAFSTIQQPIAKDKVMYIASQQSPSYNLAGKCVETPSFVVSRPHHGSESETSTRTFLSSNLSASVGGYDRFHYQDSGEVGSMITPQDSFFDLAATSAQQNWPTAVTPLSINKAARNQASANDLNKARGTEIENGNDDDLLAVVMQYTDPSPVTTPSIPASIKSSSVPSTPPSMVSQSHIDFNKQDTLSIGIEDIKVLSSQMVTSAETKSAPIVNATTTQNTVQSHYRSLLNDYA
ncbi:hypothetical protein NADFUDRAFT_77180 [Nadsonia fulvescens var. elongata DSM 6958]|uniref:Skg3/CAF120-like PH-like domain-containing protein n=1 Tax=Nadsonia fulvescens var. elongata DSM 6958 TaxID=857566 RepID=A0A1E3PQN8_9ASCO|nr:hypothetical protein NADFUDRAFT_77180 [Nadsonia fulvescens var. elongata DSM 6958]